MSLMKSHKTYRSLIRWKIQASLKLKSLLWEALMINSCSWKFKGQFLRETYSFTKTEMHNHSFEEPIVKQGGRKLMFVIAMRRCDSYGDS